MLTIFSGSKSELRMYLLQYNPTNALLTDTFCGVEFGVTGFADCTVHSLVFGREAGSAVTAKHLLMYAVFDIYSLLL